MGLRVQGLGIGAYGDLLVFVFSQNSEYIR